MKTKNKIEEIKESVVVEYGQENLKEIITEYIKMTFIEILNQE